MSDETEFLKINLRNGYFGDYQLLGDSQFVRFGVEILDLKSRLNELKRAQIGFCISGQDSSELVRLIADNYEYLDDNVIIMIGTNDVKKRVLEHTFIEAIHTLKKILEWKNVLWLTIPPLPRYQNSVMHIKKLKYFNKEIMKLHGDNIRVLDAYSLFMEADGKPKSYCFEEYFSRNGPPYRIDEIHLNRKGLIKLCAWLSFKLLPQKYNVIQVYRDRKGSIARVKLYQEFLYLSNLLTNSCGVTRDELYSYIMGPSKLST